ncbi:type VI secretion system Vgr family protein [Terriglobus saanensis]|uniref:Type VI secretion system Vgr family protein n=1 Tax=Terriglobus saanensis (strain ATCC BAA-1853 / DSM 23119 / SP1PR4) TaxID=401053 RepID=E8UX34_TERSS|nr:type VI secretion system tip protein TssI/VgrG [Terriglobus saanensis]ADV81921.1 type VI secretion system Vgr family protein [Terriglobus saanensis SP1PR4]
MSTYTQANRVLNFTSPLGANALLAAAFEGTEEISEMFNFQIDLLSLPETVISPSELVGKRVTLQIRLNEAGIYRPFNGIVSSLEMTGTDTFFNYYRVRMVPSLWLLSLNLQTRVFQNKTVLEIVQAVLEPYSILLSIETHASYETLEYCTQYRETDLNFVLRLLQQHGIFFYFTHTTSAHRLVLSDDSSHLSACPVFSEFPYREYHVALPGMYVPYVSVFSSRASLISGEHTHWDFRFMQYAASKSNPKTSKSNSSLGNNAHEIYDYSDAASAPLKTEAADAKTSLLQKHLQEVARAASDAHAIECQGRSTASTMQAGFTFTLQNHRQTQQNIKYLITQVHHVAVQYPLYRAELDTQINEPYENNFVAKPFTQPYRKAQTLLKPRVNGVVTGKVVTPAGEDSHLDKYGRVCVQFWWDRQRPPNSTDNTLLRVSQQWAGKGWGTYFWPRANDEVLIDFLDGDPDAPIVAGSIYNGVNMPKYDPVLEYTRSGIVTRSSKQGTAEQANELRFDDLKGSEQIFINAQRDFDVHVENDQHTKIDHEEHLTVTKDQYHAIGGASQLKVTEDRLVEVGGNREDSIQGSQLLSVGMNHSLKVGGSQFSKSGVAHVIQAGEEIHISGGVRVIIDGGPAGICLMSGGSAISIDASGIALQGAMRMGKADCLPPSPVPEAAPAKNVSPPKWPGDDPRKK